MSPIDSFSGLAGVNIERVLRLAHQYFLTLWQIQNPEGCKRRGLLSLTRCHAWNLAEPQQSRLAQYLRGHPVLEALYQAKPASDGILGIPVDRDHRFRHRDHSVRYRDQ